MSLSEEIMNIIYKPENSNINDKQYQKERKIYLSLSDKLNHPLRDEPARKTALSVLSQYLFQKRNKISINKSSSSYCTEQAHLLPLQVLKFFPEIKAFLKNLDITCRPDDFDNAIIGKVDTFTQALFSIRDRKYFEFKNFFFPLENCSTPLDLIFRGLFYARAKQNVKKIKWIILVIIMAFVVLILFLVK